MKIQILPSAMEDLSQGSRFYDSQELGLGDYFQDSLFSDIDSLMLFAGIHRVIYGFYRSFSKRFPYAIYYKIQESKNILVFRVLDMRQNPQQTVRYLGA